MAVQFTDFSRLPAQSPALADLLGDVLKGYQTQREPTRIRQEEESRMRDNAIKAIQQKFLPQEYGMKAQKFQQEQDDRSYLRNLMSGGMPEGGGMNMDVFKDNPFARALFKNQYGVDPLQQAPETPEQKRQAALDLFKEKEEYKAQQDAKPTAAVKTLHENIIQLSPKATKAIDELIRLPSPLEVPGGIYRPGARAAHSKAVTAAAENYAKAKGWPNTVGSLKKAEEILRRGTLESDKDYRGRLKGYKDELEEGVALSRQFLHPNQGSDESDMITVSKWGKTFRIPKSQWKEFQNAK